MPSGSASALDKLEKAEDLKKRILGCESTLKHAAFIQNSSLWKDCSSLQSLYQELLLSELEFALEKRVEQDLWTVVFRQQISHLQRISRDRKNPRINDHAAVLKWYLDSALGFYVQLLQSFCESFGFDPNTRNFSNKRDSNPNLNRSVFYAVQSCLVHLGDLSRYRNKNKLAEHYYRHATAILPSGGQPFNQLALLEAGKNEVLSACYLHARSLAVRNPFPAAAANLSKLLAKFSSKGQDNVKRGQHLSGSEYSDKFLRLQAILFANESEAISSKQLEELRSLTKTLSSQLPPLVATETINAEKLLQMITLDFFALDKIADSTDNASSVGSLVRDHLAAIFLAAVLPTYTLTDDPKDYFVLPVVYVLLVWMRHEQPAVSEAFASRPHVWPSLCHLLNSIAKNLGSHEIKPDYAVTLPEEAELKGFAPLEPAFASFRRACPDKTSEKRSANEERALRLVVLGKLLAEAAENVEVLSVTIQSEGTLLFEPTGKAGQKKAENGQTEPSSQRVSPELTPSSSIEDLSGAGVIKLPPDSVRTPGILRLIDTGAGEDQVDNGRKRMGLAGKKAFHNVALQTIMKKSGLFDDPPPKVGKQVKFIGTSPEAPNERLANGTTGGNKAGNPQIAKFKNLPPRLLAQAMNNAQVSSKDGSGDAWQYNEGSRPGIGQPVGQNTGNYPYPRPGFGQQISASLTGPRSKTPMATPFNMFAPSHPPPPSQPAPEAFRYPPPPLGPPPPSQQPPASFQGMFKQPPRMQNQQNFSTPSSLVGSVAMPVQNGVMSFAQQDRQHKPPMEAIGSGRLKKPEGFVNTSVPPPSANFGQNQQRPNDELRFFNQPVAAKQFPAPQPTNVKPGINFDLESMFRRVPPPPIAPPSRANPPMGQPPGSRLPSQFFAQPGGQTSSISDKQGLNRFPGPSNMMNGDGGRSYGGLMGQQQQRPMMSPTKDPGFFLGKPLDGGFETHNVGNQSNLSSLLVGLPRYNEGGYSLFGPPSVKNVQQGQGRPMQGHGYPPNSVDMRKNLNEGLFNGLNAQAAGNSWSSPSNGVGGGNHGPLSHGLHQAGGFTSVWNGPSPFDKLLDLPKASGEKPHPPGFMQKPTADGGQPP